jgi:hypothetical protein
MVNIKSLVVEATICFKITFRKSPVNTGKWFLRSINSELINSPELSVKCAQMQGFE